jgi:hypothetical protein
VRFSGRLRSTTRGTSKHRFLGRGAEVSTAAHPRGQSLVELALIIPLLLFMALAVFDFARVFTSAITVEAAAREAADFGGLYPWHWDSGDSIEKTQANMTTRACSAASTLTDYVGDDPSAGDPVSCTNPTVTYQLIPAPGGGPCAEVGRDQRPCMVEVTVEFDFNVIVPLRLQFGGTTLGVPPSVTITRDSTFAVSNFELDEAVAP